MAARPCSRRAHARREAASSRFGTIDSWLIYKLTGGRVHATDVTNASRTMLLDLHDARLGRRRCSSCSTFRARVLPEVRDSAGDFGETDAELFGAPIPIMGVAGDQQAAAFGQACFAPGDVKSTYGTGCFALVNTGAGRARLEQSPAEHGGLSRGRQDGLRDRGQHLRGRRGRAMAARRAGRHPRVARDRSAGAHGEIGGRTLFRARLHGPGRALLGSGRARRDPRASRATWAWRKSRAPRSTPSVSRRAIFSRRWRRDMRAAGLGAAQGAESRRRHGPERLVLPAARRSDRPGRGTPARSRKRRRSARPIWRVWPPAYFASFDDIARAWSLDRRFDPALAAAGARSGV